MLESNTPLCMGHSIPSLTGYLLCSTTGSRVNHLQRCIEEKGGPRTRALSPLARHSGRFIESAPTSPSHCHRNHTLNRFLAENGSSMTNILSECLAQCQVDEHRISDRQECIEHLPITTTSCSFPRPRRAYREYCRPKYWNLSLRVLSGQDLSGVSRPL